MGRHWKTTPDQEERDGPFADFNAWKDWLTEKMNGCGEERQTGDRLFDSIEICEESFLYRVMCDLVTEPKE